MTQPHPGLREQEILTAIVKTYITTGEPVGSRTLARSSKDGLSAATIRNVMADLADAGYLDQPHTSAGRVPTTAAYRYFVEQITGNTQISGADEDLIQDAFQSVSGVEEFLERTSHVLSLVTHNIGVVVAGGSKNALQHLHFSRLGPQKILAVVVTRSGLVRDRVLRMAADLSQAELDAAAVYLNQNFSGWTIEAMRAEVERRIRQERSEYDRLMRSVEELYRQGALAADEAARDVFVEGAANLVVSEEDRERLRQLLETLEEKQKVAELLGAYLDARQEAVRVVIGLEEAVPGLRNFVLIGAPARVGQDVAGSLAVIGPTRMDYERTISAVSYIARLFDKVLNE
ncbi:MAG: heat-inducible transcriptional repressor HrcA [Acidobacteria bacterium]|nr:heat-inducible transcriptional repressor HrcA [Acidobacteriota bacterium]